MIIILEIIGFLLCINCGLRILFAVSVYAGLKGANKYTAKGDQVEINNANLSKAANTLKKNAILFVIGSILVFIGEYFGH
jgi:transcription elongation factor Elf1